MLVSALTTYPMKSGTCTSHQRILAGPMGLVGDRRWAAVYPSGTVATRRELPQLSQLTVAESDDGLLLTFARISIQVSIPDTAAPVNAQVFSDEIAGVLDAGDAAAGFLSEVLGQELRLAYFPDAPLRRVSEKHTSEPHFTAFSDGFPILITTEPSLAALNAATGGGFSMQRFRPNLVINGAFAPWAEDTWRRIRIGEAVLRISKPCERCVMTTQDPDTGERTDPREPLYTLGKLHRSARGKIIFGQNAVIETPGIVDIGAPVDVLEEGASNLL